MPGGSRSFRVPVSPVVVSGGDLSERVRAPGSKGYAKPRCWDFKREGARPVHVPRVRHICADPGTAKQANTRAAKRYSPRGGQAFEFGSPSQIPYWFFVSVGDLRAEPRPCRATLKRKIDNYIKKSFQANASRARPSPDPETWPRPLGPRTTPISTLNLFKCRLPTNLPPFLKQHYPLSPFTLTKNQYFRPPICRHDRVRGSYIRTDGGGVVIYQIFEFLMILSH